MADDATTVDSVNALRREAERQTDLSTSDIVSLFPKDMDTDTLEGWSYLADDEKLGELPLHDVDDPLYTSYWLWETDDPDEAVTLSGFGEASEDIPYDAARAFADPREWTHQDPTNIRKDHCYRCDTDLYYGEIPGRGNDETHEGWVHDDGYQDEEAAYAADPSASARPYYVGDETDKGTPVLCYPCRDRVIDGGEFLTLAFNGEVDQGKVNGEYVLRSYYRELQTTAYFGKAFDQLIKSYAAESELTAPWAREGDIDTDTTEEYTYVNGVPHALSQAIVRGEVVPPFPVLFTSTVPQIEQDNKARQRNTVFIPENTEDAFRAAMEEAEDHDYDYVSGYGDEPPEDIWADGKFFTEGDKLDYFAPDGSVTMVRVRDADYENDTYEVRVTDMSVEKGDIGEGEVRTVEAHQLSDPEE